MALLPQQFRNTAVAHGKLAGAAMMRKTACPLMVLGWLAPHVRD